MDLVDILLTVLRRWYLALLVATLGITLSIYAASTIEPVFTVESQSLVVGPMKDTTGGTGPAGPEEERVNPYTRFSGSLDITAQAIIRIVDGSEFRSVLDEEGLAGDYEFDAPPGAALILVRAEAPTPGGASALAKRVSEGLTVTLAGIQTEVAVPEDEQITLRNLTISEPEELSGSRQRVLIGGIVVSVVLGAVVAVAADTILERRRRLAGGTPPPAEAAADVGTGDVENVWAERSPDDTSSDDDPDRAAGTDRVDGAADEADGADDEADGADERSPIGAWGHQPTR